MAVCPSACLHALRRSVDAMESLQEGYLTVGINTGNVFSNENYFSVLVLTVSYKGPTAQIPIH